MSSPSILKHRRSELEARIEEMIALLDLLDGDCDLEENGDLEPSLGGPARSVKGKLEYDLEDDIADAEPNLGWTEHQSLHGCIPTGIDEFGPVSAGLEFNGDGYHIGRKLLREHVKDKRKLAKALDRTRVSSGYGRFV